MQSAIAPNDEAGVVRFSPAYLAAWLAALLPLESAPIWIPTASRHFHISLVAAGMTASCQCLVTAIFAMFVGPLLARRPLRQPVLAAMTVMLCTSLINAIFRPGFDLFVLLRLVDGAASGICAASVGMMVNLTARPARAFGGLQFGQLFADMVVFSLSAKIVPLFGLPGLYWIVSAGLAMCLAVMPFGRDWTVRRLASAAGGTAPPAVLPAWRLGFACCAIMLIFGFLIAIITNAAGFGLRAGLTFGQVGIVLALSTPASAFGSVIATVLAGRVSPRLIVAIAGTGVVLSCLGLGLGAYNFTTVALGFACTGMFVYMGWPSILAAVSRMDGTGRAAAAAQAGLMMGPTIGPTAGALIAQISITTLAFAATAVELAGYSLASLAAWRELKSQEHDVAAESKPAPILSTVH